MYGDRWLTFCPCRETPYLKVVRVNGYWDTSGLRLRTEDCVMDYCLWVPRSPEAFSSQIDTYTDVVSTGEPEKQEILSDSAM